MIIDGETKLNTLFQMVKATLPKDKPNNSVIAFHDNSSSIRGYECESLLPTNFGKAGEMVVAKRTLHPILTAETHNFPCGVAPFPGAETGTGGRLRDVMATGRGAYTVAGVCSYCVGNLNIPGYELPWEDSSFVYPNNLASPLDIEVEASNGASDYGNKFGEPVIHGFTRSFGQRLPNGERFEWVKPIMFTAGIGYLDDLHTKKFDPEIGMLVVKVGGPAYRIGIGGGAASSRVQSGENADLDFDAVQRGDAEMENRLMRLMRSCCDLAANNPIISCHDQGAGGNGNVLKEIVEGAGAKYDIRKVSCSATKYEFSLLVLTFIKIISLYRFHLTFTLNYRCMLETILFPCLKFGEPNTRRTMLFSSNRNLWISSTLWPSVKTVLTVFLVVLQETAVSLWKTQLMDLLLLTCLWSWFLARCHKRLTLIIPLNFHCLI